MLLLVIILRNTAQNEQEVQIATQEEREEEITDYVRAKGEKERMQVYLAEFLRLLERGEYSAAYKKLYPGFKQNYFESEAEFKAYARLHYSELLSVEYEDIQRQGTYYLLTVNITNLGELGTNFTQMFIIHELGLNDYQISFQAKN